MKQLFLQALLVCTAAFSFFRGYAQVSEDFNTRTDVATPDEVKPYLQDHCWFFPDMDVNNGSWNPQIEGDGAMVSGSDVTPGQTTGIYTPLLDIPGNLSVSFNYKFSTQVNQRRWIKLYLVDHENNIYMLLDSVELTGNNNTTSYTYSNTFYSLPSGAYKLYINYQGMNGSPGIAIDQLSINRPFLYSGGCNQPPVAVNDVINGTASHAATGHLCSNDYDPNGDYFNCYVIDNPPDGSVSMNANGSFTFIPNAGFTGSSTSFTYQICDHGFGPLCSNIATATINFPTAGMLPVKLIDFTASVNDDRNVIIRWTTTMEQGTDYFEMERSLDGRTFQTIGTVKAAGNSGVKLSYSYTDKLNNNVANKDIYYRLRLVDLNARGEISKVLIVRLFRSESTKMISITPNPVKNDINVQVQLKENSYVVMKVIDNNGAELMRKSLRGDTGFNVFALDGTGKLQPGSYMLEVIINSHERMMAKLIKN